MIEDVEADDVYLVADHGYAVYQQRLPAEVHAEVLVEPPVMRLEVLLQPPPGGQIHLLLIINAVSNRKTGTLHLQPTRQYPMTEYGYRVSLRFQTPSIPRSLRTGVIDDSRGDGHRAGHDACSGETRAGALGFAAWRLERPSAGTTRST